jgi:hypothetical protein
MAPAAHPRRPAPERHRYRRAKLRGATQQYDQHLAGVDGARRPPPRSSHRRTIGGSLVLWMLLPEYIQRFATYLNPQSHFRLVVLTRNVLMPGGAGRVFKQLSKRVQHFTSLDCVSPIPIVNS